MFIGLILGGLPAIAGKLKGKPKGVVGAALFVAFFALILLLQVLQSENVAAIRLSFGEVVKLFFLGALASATMVIPGVSGSMILKLLGYYEPIVTEAIPGLLSAFAGGEWSAVWLNVGILFPFGVGILVGIFAIAKIIEWLLARCHLLRHSGTGNRLARRHSDEHGVGGRKLEPGADEPGHLCGGLSGRLAAERQGKNGLNSPYAEAQKRFGV